jgi:threonyl-tRNA synthetase
LQVFWHSTAHVLGEAMERYYGGCLCYGPPIENGFYYDMYHEVRNIFLLYQHFQKNPSLFSGCAHHAGSFQRR